MAEFCMNDETIKWIERAEGDYNGGVHLAKKRSRQFAHLVCFAFQQSAEKFLKAYLVEKGIPFPKVHEIELKLIPLCASVDPEFRALKAFASHLDPFAVEFRYPGEDVTQEDARNAKRAATKVRTFVRAKLGLANQKRLL